MRLRTRLAAVLVAAPLVLSGCGGSGTTSPAPGAPNTSTAAVALPAVAPGQTVDKDAFVEAMTKAQQEAKTSAINMDMDITTQGKTTKVTVAGVADLSDPASPRMKLGMTVPGVSAPIDMIMIDNSVFMKMPQSGDKYLQMSMADLTKATGQDLTQLMDPSKQLERSKAAITQVTFIGDEDVNGTKTRHYRAVLDGQAAMAMAGQTSLPSTMSLSNSIPYDLWMDEKFRPRKITMNMSMGSAMTMKMSGTMDKYGEPVTITRPPASQVTSTPVPSSGGTATSS